MFTANIQAVTNVVKWGYVVGLLRKPMSVGRQNFPHRRLEIKKVSEQGGPDPPRSTLHTHLETTTAGQDLRVTRLTYNSGVRFRNRYDCWSRWPSQSKQLRLQFLFVLLWISWNYIHHRISVSNGWVLSIKKSVPSKHRVSRTRTRLRSYFHRVFRILNRSKMSE